MLGWCAATLTSVALAWVAMMPVLRTATADEGTLMSLDQLRDTGEIMPTPAPPPPLSPPAPSPSARKDAKQEEADQTKPGKPSSSAPAPAKSRTPSRTKSTPAPTTPEPATTIEDGWTVTTAGDGGRTYVRSFRVEGGRTVIRASDGVIELVTATPADGFAVATVQNTPDNLAVYFNETNHSFIVHVVWQAGKPFAQVNEVGA